MSRCRAFRGESDGAADWAGVATVRRRRHRARRAAGLRGDGDGSQPGRRRRGAGIRRDSRRGGTARRRRGAARRGRGARPRRPDRAVARGSRCRRGAGARHRARRRAEGAHGDRTAQPARGRAPLPRLRGARHRRHSRSRCHGESARRAGHRRQQRDGEPLAGGVERHGLHRRPVPGDLARPGLGSGRLQGGPEHRRGSAAQLDVALPDRCLGDGPCRVHLDHPRCDREDGHRHRFGELGGDHPGHSGDGAGRRLGEHPGPVGGEHGAHLRSRAGAAAARAALHPRLRLRHRRHHRADAGDLAERCGDGLGQRGGRGQHERTRHRPGRHGLGVLARDQHRSGTDLSLRPRERHLVANLLFREHLGYRWRERPAARGRCRCPRWCLFRGRLRDQRLVGGQLLALVDERGRHRDGEPRLPEHSRDRHHGRNLQRRFRLRRVREPLPRAQRLHWHDHARHDLPRERDGHRRGDLGFRDPGRAALQQQQPDVRRQRRLLRSARAPVPRHGERAALGLAPVPGRGQFGDAERSDHGEHRPRLLLLPSDGETAETAAERAGGERRQVRARAAIRRHRERRHHLGRLRARLHDRSEPGERPAGSDRRRLPHHRRRTGHLCRDLHERRERGELRFGVAVHGRGRIDAAVERSRHLGRVQHRGPRERRAGRLRVREQHHAAGEDRGSGVAHPGGRRGDRHLHAPLRQQRGPRAGDGELPRLPARCARRRRLHQRGRRDGLGTGLVPRGDERRLRGLGCGERAHQRVRHGAAAPSAR